MCVVLNFINIIGFLFKFYFFFKYEEYFVIGFGFKLKLMIDRFEFYSYVEFYVKDLDDKWIIFLNEELSILVVVVVGCLEYLDVFVIVE